MAPLPFDDLNLSSLELDNLATTPTQRLHAREILPRADPDPNWKPGGGTQDPASINNSGFIALFAIIGAAMVIASLWFFFWAKNGGFHFQQGDWDDYKSTVLRRKGPDGKTLSNATKSTKLGGGSIAGTQQYKWARQAAKSVIGRDEKGRKGILGKRGWAGTHSVTYSDDFSDSLATQTVGDMSEVREEILNNGHSRRYRDRDVQDYKREKPARVGGLNRVADGSHFDTDRSETMTEASDEPILAHQRKKDQAKERAERKAREEAAKMERRWKKEAEEAAAALARENARPPPPPAHTAKKSAVPSSSSKPAAQKTRRASRASSPKKAPTDYSDVQSTAYTQTTSNRTASYYEEYRPQASVPQRQSSPTKGKSRQSRTTGGYRRGGESELD